MPPLKLLGCSASTILAFCLEQSEIENIILTPLLPTLAGEWTHIITLGLLHDD